MGVANYLKQDVTYWPITGSDGFGGFTFGTARKIKARWEDKAMLFLTDTLEEQVSSAVAYLPLSDDAGALDAAVGDYLCEGDQTAVADPTTLAAARRIRQAQKTTNLRGAAAFRKAIM